MTQATHRRFWQAMGERFGKRWLEEYGPEPTLAWMHMLDRYKPLEVKAGLEAMAARGWQHPPTQPQFEAVLVDAAKKGAGDAQDYARGFWRTEIVQTVLSEGNRLGKWRLDWNGFEQLVIERRHTLGDRMLGLLNEVDGLEKTTGQRTPGMHTLVARRATEIAAAYRARPVLEVV
jgi:hypothetical protein